MTIIANKPFTQLTNLNLTDELRIKGVLVTPSGGSLDNIIEVSSTYLALITDDVIVADGTFTVDLPAVLTAVKRLTIKSVLGGGTITVDGNGADTIEGSATQTLTPGTGFTICPTTTGWEIVGV